MNKVRRNCLVCGKEFFIYPNREKTAKYCSYSCYHKDMKGKVRTTLEHRKQKKKEQDRRYYLKHKEKKLAKAKVYIKNHPEIKKESTKRYYWKHREQDLARKKTPEYKVKFKIYAKKYRTKHKEELSAKNKEYRSKPEIKIKIKKRNIEYQRKPERKEWIRLYKAKPEIHERYLALSRAYKKTEKGKAIARYSSDRRRLRQEQVTVGYTKAQYWNLVKKTDGFCPVCNHPFTLGFHSKHELTIDHNPPISKAPKGFIYKIENVSILCRSCNSKKGNRF